MMRQIWYWGFLAAVACAFASCVKEKLDYRVTEVEEGLPATVTLKYGVVHNEVVTRAAQQEEYEYRVGNLYVFIFDGQGNKHEGKLFMPGAERFGFFRDDDLEPRHDCGHRQCDYCGTGGDGLHDYGE